MSLDFDQVIVSKEIVYRTSEGQTVLYSPRSRSCYRLDRAAGRMWRLLSDQGSLQAVMKAMTQEYDVSPDQLQKDLSTFVWTLQAGGFLEVDTKI
jgi:hypothetical protein